jgi:CubicO group peptidase (beta-lactamase class C family)
MPHPTHSRRTILRHLALTGWGVVSSFGAPAPRSLVPAAQLKAAAEYSAARKGCSFLVIQHGKVLHESYAHGAKRSDVHRIYSGTKGFWGLAALAAVEDGVVSLDETVADTIREWRADDAKARIKVRQLLDFTCGLERGLVLHNDGLKNRNSMAIARPLVARPGKSFIYGPASLQVFHELLKRKLAAADRKNSPTRYLERRVLGPMGLRSQRYLPDQSGNPLLAAGFIMTAQQWSKMGHCLLRAGHPVIGSDSFEKIREGSGANAAYNLGFWNNRAAGKAELVSCLPLQGRTFRHAGLHRQRLPAAICDPVDGPDRCAPGTERRLFGRNVSAFAAGQGMK